MIANLMGGDLVFVVIIAILVLGFGSQLPKIARNLGTAGREFRKAQQEAEEEAERDRAAKTLEEARKAAVPPAVPLPAPAPAAAQPAEAAITLTPAELEALLKAREEQVRNQTGSAT